MLSSGSSPVDMREWDATSLPSSRDSSSTAVSPILSLMVDSCLTPPLPDEPITPRSLVARNLCTLLPSGTGPKEGEDLLLSGGREQADLLTSFAEDDLWFVSGDVLGRGASATVHVATKVFWNGDTGRWEPDRAEAAHALRREVYPPLHTYSRPSSKELEDKLTAASLEEAICRRASAVAPEGVIHLNRMRSWQQADGTSAMKRLYLDSLMECGGPNLETMLSGGRFSQLNGPQCARSLLETLARLHDHHLVHLDVKPLNILVDAGGAHLRLCDFGRSNDLALSSSEQFKSNPSLQRVWACRTSPGITTPLYAPPEIREIWLDLMNHGTSGWSSLAPLSGSPTQYQDHEYVMGPRFDVFAAGIVLWKLATLTPLPILGARLHNKEYLPPPYLMPQYQQLQDLVQDQPELREDPLIQTAVLCMHPDPAQRPKNGIEALAALDRALAQSSQEQAVPA